MGYFWPGLPEYLPDWARANLGPSTTFVETGTYLGGTARAVLTHFASVDTIELDPALYEQAVADLADTRVRCHLGDSREVLAAIIPGRSEPMMIWLDAHYSGGITAGVEDPCPIFGELNVLFAYRTTSDTVLVVDDVRLFVGCDGYPQLDELGDFLREAGWSWQLVDDVLVATSAELLDSLSSTREAWRQHKGAIGDLWPGVTALLQLRRQRGYVAKSLRALRRRSG